MFPVVLVTVYSQADLGQAQANVTALNKAEGKTKLKRERSSTTTLTKPAKIARRTDGRECIDLASDSEDGGIEPEKMAPPTNAGTRNDEIEVIDLL